MRASHVGIRCVVVASDQKKGLANLVFVMHNLCVCVCVCGGEVFFFFFSFPLDLLQLL
jgi:hypothetical protein